MDTEKRLMIQAAAVLRQPLHGRFSLQEGQDYRRKQTHFWGSFLDPSKSKLPVPKVSTGSRFFLHSTRAIALMQSWIWVQFFPSFDLASLNHCFQPTMSIWWILKRPISKHWQFRWAYILLIFKVFLWIWHGYPMGWRTSCMNLVW